MPVTRYTYSGRGHVAWEDRNGTALFYRHDVMGSTTQLFDTAGTTTDTFRFDYFGVSLGRTGSTPTPMQWLSDSGTYTPQGGGKSLPLLGVGGGFPGRDSPYDPSSGASLGRWVLPPEMADIGELIDWLMSQGWWGLDEVAITWSTGPGAPMGPFPNIGPIPPQLPNPGSTYQGAATPEEEGRATPWRVHCPGGRDNESEF